MKRIFLGPLLHWLILIVVIALGWFAGEARLHVRNFNLFLVISLVGSVLILIIVLASSRPGEKVTRDTLEE